MAEMTKRQLTIANMKLQTENARQASKIRDMERENAKLRQHIDIVRDASAHLARLATP